MASKTEIDVLDPANDSRPQAADQELAATQPSGLTVAKPVLAVQEEIT
ncbi:MAG: hypothetical protein IPO17_03295 [Flavobacteriales bacterium]|nr:hypothetical protein [Flavobacteriales bacterium]